MQQEDKFISERKGNLPFVIDYRQYYYING